MLALRLTLSLKYMKSVILAAGYATRLGELTKNFPKPLLQIGQNTILGRILDDIDTIPEITEHIIVTNHKFAPIFEKWAAEQHYTKPLRIIDDGTETNETRLGAVCDLLLAIKETPSNSTLSSSSSLSSPSSSSLPSKGDKRSEECLEGLHKPSLCREGLGGSLLVLAADNLLFFSFRDFINFAKEKNASCIMCHEQPSIEKLQRTGVVVLDEQQRVLNMEEKPQQPKSHWAVPPFYFYHEKDLDLILHAIENGCGKDAPGNLAHYLVDHTEMYAWKMNGGRFDIGSLDTYHEAIEKFG